MKMLKDRIVLFLIILILTGCEDLFFESDPPDNPINNFEIFWQDYDRYYPFFNLKHLNWDSVYIANKPLISSSTSPKHLFDILGDMIQYLKDGHADLCTQNMGCSRFDFDKNYPVNQLNSVGAYVNLATRSRSISYGIIEPDIGYIHIRSFGGNESDFKVVDDILASLKKQELKGIVVDIRGNGGGSDTYSQLIANRFTDRNRVYSYVRYKSGPAHDEFGGWVAKSIKPDGESYLKPVILLTNRQVFSSAEDFVLAMKTIPSIKVLGDTTGGGSGNPILRVLPNGWKFRVPRWQQVDNKMDFYEGNGIVPDIPIWITDSDLSNGKDTILEKAIEELRKI